MAPRSKHRPRSLERQAGHCSISQLSGFTVSHSEHTNAPYGQNEQQQKKS